ncbi:hypothetical protein PR048_012129 [Dryococelus australis]|uniref:Uncharacterized protein n=1 Tax=Dryococelus australis TaxID=614101 RepID=A0ABQ9HPS2_9NEOP|nr:hypothetical protein PR048_012129 [Dryococelus australis]
MKCGQSYQFLTAIRSKSASAATKVFQTQVMKVKALLLKQLDKKLLEQMLMTKIFVSFPQKFKNIVSAWESVSTKDQKFSELKVCLLIE